MWTLSGIAFGMVELIRRVMYRSSPSCYVPIFYDLFIAPQILWEVISANYDGWMPLWFVVTFICVHAI